MKRAAAPLALALALALVTALVLLALGCGKRDGHVDEGGAFDLETMAYLSEARALHHQAGIKEDSGDLAGAVAALGRLTAAARPHPERTTPEVEEVLVSLPAVNEAAVELRMGNTDAALASVHEGLRHAETPTFFRGHLLEVEGLVEKARGGALADAGREAEARAARERAIDLLDQAVKVQEGVILAALRDGGGDR